MNFYVSCESIGVLNVVILWLTSREMRKLCSLNSDCLNDIVFQITEMQYRRKHLQSGSTTIFRRYSLVNFICHLIIGKQDNFQFTVTNILEKVHKGI